MSCQKAHVNSSIAAQNIKKPQSQIHIVNQMATIATSNSKTYISPWILCGVCVFFPIGAFFVSFHFIPLLCVAIYVVKFAPISMLLNTNRIIYPND